jgi:hypothetical protein
MAMRRIDDHAAARNAIIEGIELRRFFLNARSDSIRWFHVLESNLYW